MPPCQVSARACVAVLLVSTALAQGPARLLADLDPRADPSASSSPRALSAAGGRLWFWTIEDGGTLWVTDGTAANTSRVRWMGRVPAAARAVDLGGALVALVEGGLLRSDGTPAGTTLLAPLAWTEPESVPVTLGGRVLFSGSDVAQAAARLWRSDGTAAGTARIVGPDPAMSVESGVTRAGGLGFFRGVDPVHGEELWCSDGSEAGTRLVADIHPTASAFPYHERTAFADLGGTLLLFANDGVHGLELWRSDGTPAGTSLVRDVNPGSAAGPLRRPLVASGARAFFVADDGVHGTELWTTNGTGPGTSLVADLNPGAGGLPIGNDLVALGNGVVLFTMNTAGGSELWRSDGTAAGTVVLRTEPSVLADAVLLAGRAYFAAGDATHGAELWASDGTPTGTTLVADLVPGPAGSGPTRFARLGNQLLFAAGDPVHGTELWRSDGTAAGSSLVADLAAYTGDSAPQEFTAFGEQVLFGATTPATGLELWRSDGTAAGTNLVREFVPGAQGSNLRGLTVAAGRLFFQAWDPLSTLTWRLWTTDGTAGGTTNLPVPYVSPVVIFEMSAAREDRLVFEALDHLSNATSLWSTDGTPSGTQPAWLFTSVSARGPATFFRGTLWLRGEERATGLELWQTDGTGAGTRRFLDIWPGPQSSRPGDPVRLRGQLFFGADDGVHGHELWTTDGTAAGTRLFLDLRPGPSGSGPGLLTVAGDVLLFRANDGVHGTELWRTDGTPAGTALVADLVPGTNGPNGLRSLVRFGPLVLFHAGVQREFGLWRSDGTGAGTFLLRAFDRESLSLVSDEDLFVFAPPGAARALFPGFDPAHGIEPWVTDGTVAGTVLLQDLAPGPRGSWPAHPALIGNRIYLQANDGVHGVEPMWLPGIAAVVPLGDACAPAGSAEPEVTTQGGAPVLGNASFALRLRSAPAHAPLFFGVSLTPARLPLGAGCWLYLDPTTLAFSQLGLTDGAGEAVVSLPIPSDPSLDGGQAMAQFLAVDVAMSAVATPGAARVLLARN